MEFFFISISNIARMQNSLSMVAPGHLKGVSLFLITGGPTYLLEPIIGSIAHLGATLGPCHRIATA